MCIFYFEKHEFQKNNTITYIIHQNSTIVLPCAKVKMTLFLYTNYSDGL